MSIVDRIKNLCSEKGTTMTALERELGFGKGILRKWDDASPNSDKLQKVADYFHVSIDYLLDRKLYIDEINLSNYINVHNYKDENGVIHSRILSEEETNRRIALKHLLSTYDLLSDDLDFNVLDDIEKCLVPYLQVLLKSIKISKTSHN